MHTMFEFMYEFENFQRRKIIKFCCGKIKDGNTLGGMEWCGEVGCIATTPLSLLSPPNFQTIKMRKKKKLNEMCSKNNARYTIKFTMI